MTELAKAELRLEEYVRSTSLHVSRFDIFTFRQLLANLETAVRVTDESAPF